MLQTQSPPKTIYAVLARPRVTGPATAMAYVLKRPNAVSARSSQPSPSKCCDDHLNLPLTPHRGPNAIGHIVCYRQQSHFAWRGRGISYMTNPTGRVAERSRAADVLGRALWPRLMGEKWQAHSNSSNRCGPKLRASYGRRGVRPS